MRMVVLRRRVVFGSDMVLLPMQVLLPGSILSPRTFMLFLLVGLLVVAIGIVDL